MPSASTCQIGATASCQSSTHATDAGARNAIVSRASSVDGDAFGRDRLAVEQRHFEHRRLPRRREPHDARLDRPRDAERKSSLDRREERRRRGSQRRLRGRTLGRDASERERTRDAALRVDSLRLPARRVDRDRARAHRERDLDARGAARHVPFEQHLVHTGFERDPHCAVVLAAQRFAGARVDEDLLGRE
jgi:hypothetical protein